jgi:enamine deaminase RidA (YjgF/YER057c/UK114 family)
MEPEARLRELGIALPPAPRPVASYVPWVRAGHLLFVSGQLPFRKGELICRGCVPDEVSPEEAAEAARQAALNALAVVREALGTLNRVERIVRLTGYVFSRPDFRDHPQVMNGASDFLVEVFGERGRHSRVTVGVASLPLGSPVELDLIVEVG